MFYRTVVPDDARDVAIRRYDRDRLRCVEGRIRLRRAADRTGAIMRVMRIALVGLPGRRVAVADFNALERIRGGDGGRPARADRCENLHHQCDQDDRKKFL